MPGQMKPAWQGWLSVLGGALVHLSLGATYSYGNMYPYLTSYIRAGHIPPSDLNDTTVVWLGAISTFMHGALMSVGGLLSRKIGIRLAVLVGCVIMTSGFALSWLCVQHSFYLVLLTYGFVVGTGVGISYAPCIECAVKWVPHRRGLVSGLVAAGYGGGAFVTNQLLTCYINPNNLSPTLHVNGAWYYDPSVAQDLLDRVPSSFLVLTGLYGGLQILGLLLLRNPPDPEADPLDIPDDEEIPTNYLGVHYEDSEPLMSEAPDVHPQDVIRTRGFYILWFTLFFNTLATFYIANFYKEYGQTFISDDHFLALLGAIAAVFNSAGRVVWGQLMDRFSYKSTMLCLCASMMSWLVTLPACVYGGKAMFFIWVCAIFFTFSGNFALMPAVMAKAFGKNYLAVNHGILFTSLCITAPSGALLAGVLTDGLGWNGLFQLAGGFTLISFILTLVLDLRVPAQSSVDSLQDTCR